MVGRAGISSNPNAEGNGLGLVVALVLGGTQQNLPPA